MAKVAHLTAQRKARQEAGLSIRQLEVRTGINRGVLSMYERGMRITPEQVAIIKRVLIEALTERSA